MRNLRPRRIVLLAGLGLVVAGATIGSLERRAVAATATVTINPVSHDAGPGFVDGENVNVSVGPNTVFKPGTRVNILECADPGGSVTNLPKSISNCDGNTIEANTVYVQANGSVVEDDYTIYSLPSRTLDETPQSQPVCDSTSECVLYVGENQEDFTQPKLFSVPFTVSAGPGSYGAAPTADGSPASASSASDAGPEGTAPTTEGLTGGDPSSSASLAYTGAPPWTPWIMATGVLLTVAGTAGRRLFGAAR